MKKSTYLTLLLLSVMILAVISCSKKEEEAPVAAPLVSGIFQGDTLYLNDSVVASVIFSFDELEDGTVNGGVRIRIIGHKQNYRQQKYLSQHTMTTWTKGTDSITVVAGEADMGDDLGIIAFSGKLNGSEPFDYTLMGQGFADEETAVYIGGYIRPGDTKSTLTTNYVGTYSVTCGSASTETCFVGDNYTCDAFNLTLHITAQTPNCCGGISLTGYFAGDVPNIGSNNHVLDDQSEVYAGYLSTETDNYGFAFGCNDCIWNPAATYGCDWGYAIYWTPDDTCGDLFGEYCLQGNINMGAKQ